MDILPSLPAHFHQNIDDILILQSSEHYGLFLQSGLDLSSFWLPGYSVCTMLDRFRLKTLEVVP